MSSSFVRRFLFEGLDIRGAIVHLGDAWQGMQAGRNYQPTVAQLLGETAAVTALIAAQLKQPGRLTLQLRGGGPIQLLIMDCNEQLQMRGMARSNPVVLPAPVPDLLGVHQGGQLLMSLDLPTARQRTQQASALRELARAQRTRDVSVGIQYEHAGANANNSYSTTSYGLSVSVPLFINYDYRGEIARSEADYTAAEQQLLATRAAVSNEQARLQAEVDASRARHQRLRDVVLPAAEKAARGADVAIQKGAMSLTDYLDTQRSLRSARIEATLARAELARAGLLLRLAGDTP